MVSGVLDIKGLLIHREIRGILPYSLKISNSKVTPLRYSCSSVEFSSIVRNIFKCAKLRLKDCNLNVSSVCLKSHMKF